MVAFTDKNRTLISELLGVFQGVTFDWFDYNSSITGEVASVPFGQQIDFSTVATRLDEIIAVIETEVDGRKARVDEILTEYDCVSLQHNSIGPGGASGAAGFRYTTEAHEAKLKRKLEDVIGLRSVVRNIAGRSDGSNTSMPVGR